MSLCDLEEYFHDYYKLVNKGSLVRSGQRRRFDNYPGKKVSDRAVVAKIIYDPQNTLSKRAHKRLQVDCSDGFCTNVPYSLNKRGRWKTASAASLLRSYSSSGPEFCVINREVTPFTFDDYAHSNTVTHMHVLNGETVATIASAGRKKAMRYYTKQLRECRGIDGEEVEPARIHFNIVTPPRISRLNTRTFRKANRTLAKRNKYELAHCDPEVFPDVNFSTDDGMGPNSNDSCLTSRKFTLGDFITSKHPSTSSHGVKNVSTGSGVNSSFEIIAIKPAAMTDISQATNSPHIFEIIDVRLNRLDSFDLKKEIILLLPGYCTAQWFNPERVSIASKRSVVPMFVLFFEIWENLGILRIRVNVSAQYSPDYDKQALVKLLKTKKNFPSLFADLISFIFSLEPSASPQKDFLRYSKCKEGFMRSVNSERMAAKTFKACEHDQLDFLRSYYTGDDFEIVSIDNAKCSRCSSPYNSDLFPARDGMICRQCIAAVVIRQLRLNHLPIEIPVITSNETSPIDLLYAVLPLPVMSLFLKVSYSYYYSLLHPDSSLVQCPQCSASLVVTDRSEFNCCMCSSCGCCWCYLCDWEPHWPLTCDEFKKWSEKWDIQWNDEPLWINLVEPIRTSQSVSLPDPIDKFNLDKGERLLRIQCQCGTTFHAPENTAHWTTCSNTKCQGLYDKNGLLRYSCNLFWPFPPRHRKTLHHPDDEFFKYGDRVQPEYLEQKKLINKEYANMCVDARKLRFGEQRRSIRRFSEVRKSLWITVDKRREFADAVVRKFSCEQHRVIDLRQTALFLVENCTAWLYLHRSEEGIHFVKKTVLLLFQQFLLFEDQILNSRVGHKEYVEDLEKCVSNVIDLFRRYTVQNDH
ncbi:hypothetical protein Y032_0638g965 [Ancylostoma ceylanicum]|uniref:IBR domain-containing protein n=1 Tax=Ancylostoma ceylanicum TaxID=53326 RepID=A0A016WKN6_9BILA|nr:hypothetical protein Y032_0638g965 [Ancylostoma ceylanicum]